MKKRKKFSKIEKILFAVLIWVLITAVYLWNKRNDTTIGTFGGTFNNYLSPSISLVAAFLVYISFREQIKANRMLQAQWSFDIYLRMFNDIKDSLQKISVGDSVNGLVTYEGVDAFSKIARINGQSFVSGVFNAFRDLEPVLKEFLRLINKLQAEELKEDYLEYKVFLYYQSHIQQVVDCTFTYFEKNPQRVLTRGANENLLQIMKQIENKMKTLQLKFNDEFVQESEFNS